MVFVSLKQINELLTRLDIEYVNGELDLASYENAYKEIYTFFGLTEEAYNRLVDENWSNSSSFSVLDHNNLSSN